ncbi:MAG: DNA gyrase inhibitor YacG [Gammaproteobacteria bacterium]|nr:DNA gyrase inhibitor YacG [Gammaproteobacteria bacterium]MBU0826664.1 DNA gyrase inhibitor YacG [Gammaproteobacteria bacterium]
MAHPERDRAAPTARIVTCPCCGGDSIYAPSNAYRPFCSERCKQVDLGAWASEDFRMPAETPPGDAPRGDSYLPH